MGHQKYIMGCGGAKYKKKRIMGKYMNKYDLEYRNEELPIQTLIYTFENGEFRPGIWFIYLMHYCFFFCLIFVFNFLICYLMTDTEGANMSKVADISVLVSGG